MEPDVLIARIAEEDGTLVVCAPAVGLLGELPERGTHLHAGASVAPLRILGRRLMVKLPAHAHGWIAERLVDGREAPVEYGQPLLRLKVAEVAGLATEPAGTSLAEEGAAADLSAVTAPSDGIFYRRPGPGSPPYVEEGSSVRHGSVLGLVEVMKSFHQIAYGGSGLPEHGTVARIIAADGAEVEFGAKLFLIRAEASKTR